MSELSEVGAQLTTIATLTSKRVSEGKQPDIKTLSQRLENIASNESLALQAERIVYKRFISEYAGLLRAAAVAPSINVDIPYETAIKDNSVKQFLHKFASTEAGLFNLIDMHSNGESVDRNVGDEAYFKGMSTQAEESGLVDLIRPLWQLNEAVAKPGCALNILPTLKSGVCNEVALSKILQRKYGCVVARASETLDLRCGIDVIVYANQEDFVQRKPLMFVDGKALPNSGEMVLVEPFHSSSRKLQAMKETAVNTHIFTGGYGNKDILEIPHLVVYYPSVRSSKGFFEHSEIGIPSAQGLNRVDEALQRHCKYQGLEYVYQALTKKE